MLPSFTDHYGAIQRTNLPGYIQACARKAGESLKTLQFDDNLNPEQITKVLATVVIAEYACDPKYYDKPFEYLKKLQPRDGHEMKYSAQQNLFTNDSTFRKMTEKMSVKQALMIAANPKRFMESYQKNLEPSRQNTMKK